MLSVIQPHVFTLMKPQNQHFYLKFSKTTDVQYFFKTDIMRCAFSLCRVFTMLHSSSIHARAKTKWQGWYFYDLYLYNTTVRSLNSQTLRVQWRTENDRHKNIPYTCMWSLFYNILCLVLEDKWKRRKYRFLLIEEFQDNYNEWRNKVVIVFITVFNDIIYEVRLANNRCS